MLQACVKCKGKNKCFEFHLVRVSGVFCVDLHYVHVDTDKNCKRIVVTVFKRLIDLFSRITKLYIGSPFPPGMGSCYKHIHYMCVLFRRRIQQPIKREQQKNPPALNHYAGLILRDKCQNKVAVDKQHPGSFARELQNKRRNTKGKLNYVLLKLTRGN